MYKIPAWIGSIRQVIVWLGITVGVLLLSSCTWEYLTDSLDIEGGNNMELEATAHQGCQLVWSDEFDVNGLPDPNRWRYNVGAGLWGNQESQFYTDARLVSREEWTYRRFEVVARLPSGRGTWPALWLLSDLHQYVRMVPGK